MRRLPMAVPVLVILLGSAACAPAPSATSSPGPSASTPIGPEIRLVGQAPVLEAAALDGKSYALPGAYAIVDFG